MTALATTTETAHAKAPPSSAAVKLSGPEKALLFLVSIEERTATRILSYLSESEVTRLRNASETLREVDPSVVIEVHRVFAEFMQQGVPTSLQGSGAYLRRLAGKALGEGRVADIWTEQQRPEGPVARLAEFDVPTILALIEHEKPQTLAVILSQFDPGRAAEVVMELPADKQAEIVLRMARLKSVPENVIHDIERQLSAEVAALGESKRRDIEGVNVAANLVKRMENDLSEALLEELASLDDTVAENLKKNLFTFEDLLRIDGRGMQQLLKEVATDQLVVALKSASDDLREKVFGNVSSRAAGMLRDEIEMLGPVKVSDVETAQQAICQVALQLEQDGRIQIAREGGGDYV